MSDTPETDKQWADWLNKLRMPIESFVDVARKLERERDDARLQVKLLRVENNHNWQANDLAEQAFRERDQWKDIAERSIGYVYENDWDPEACDIIKDYEKLAGGPHPIHSK